MGGSILSVGVVAEQKAAERLSMICKKATTGIDGSVSLVHTDTGAGQAAISAVQVGTVYALDVGIVPAVAGQTQANGVTCTLSLSIPFTLATSLGLAAVALQLPLSKAEAGAGLVPAATAVHIFGTAGGVLILIMLFMAVTASGSHEMVSRTFEYLVSRNEIVSPRVGDERTLTALLCLV